MSRKRKSFKRRKQVAVGDIFYNVKVLVAETKDGRCIYLDPKASGGSRLLFVECLCCNRRGWLRGVLVYTNPPKWLRSHKCAADHWYRPTPYLENLSLPELEAPIREVVEPVIETPAKAPALKHIRHASDPMPADVRADYMFYVPEDLKAEAEAMTDTFEELKRENSIKDLKMGDPVTAWTNGGPKVEAMFIRAEKVDTRTKYYCCEIESTELAKIYDKVLRR